MSGNIAVSIGIFPSQSGISGASDNNSESQKSSSSSSGSSSTTNIDAQASGLSAISKASRKKSSGRKHKKRSDDIGDDSETGSESDDEPRKKKKKSKKKRARDSRKPYGSSSSADSGSDADESSSETDSSYSSSSESETEESADSLDMWSDDEFSYASSSTEYSTEDENGERIIVQKTPENKGIRRVRSLTDGHRRKTNYVCPFWNIKGVIKQIKKSRWLDDKVIYLHSISRQFYGDLSHDPVMNITLRAHLNEMTKSNTEIHEWFARWLKVLQNRLRFKIRPGGVDAGFEGLALGYMHKTPLVLVFMLSHFLGYTDSEEEITPTSPPHVIERYLKRIFAEPRDLVKRILKFNPYHISDRTWSYVFWCLSWREDDTFDETGLSELYYREPNGEVVRIPKVLRIAPFTSRQVMRDRYKSSYPGFGEGTDWSNKLLGKKTEVTESDKARERLGLPPVAVKKERPEATARNIKLLEDVLPWFKKLGLNKRMMRDVPPDLLYFDPEKLTEELFSVETRLREIYPMLFEREARRYANRTDTEIAVENTADMEVWIRMERDEMEKFIVDVLHYEIKRERKMKKLGAKFKDLSDTDCLGPTTSESEEEEDDHSKDAAAPPPPKTAADILGTGEPKAAAKPPMGTVISAMAAGPALEAPKPPEKKKKPPYKIKSYTWKRLRKIEQSLIQVVQARGEADWKEGAAGLGKERVTAFGKTMSILHKFIQKPPMEETAATFDVAKPALAVINVKSMRKTVGGKMVSRSPTISKSNTSAYPTADNTGAPPTADAGAHDATLGETEKPDDKAPTVTVAVEAAAPTVRPSQPNTAAATEDGEGEEEEDDEEEEEDDFDPGAGTMTSEELRKMHEDRRRLPSRRLFIIATLRAYYFDKFRTICHHMWTEPFQGMEMFNKICSVNRLVYTPIRQQVTMLMGWCKDYEALRFKNWQAEVANYDATHTLLEPSELRLIKEFCCHCVWRRVAVESEGFDDTDKLLTIQFAQMMLLRRRQVFRERMKIRNQKNKKRKRPLFKKKQQFADAMKPGQGESAAEEGKVDGSRDMSISLLSDLNLDDAGENEDEKGKRKSVVEGAKGKRKSVMDQIESRQSTADSSEGGRGKGQKKQKKRREGSIAEGDDAGDRPRSRRRRKKRNEDDEDEDDEDSGADEDGDTRKTSKRRKSKKKNKTRRLSQEEENESGEDDSDEERTRSRKLKRKGRSRKRVEEDDNDASDTSSDKPRRKSKRKKKKRAKEREDDENAPDAPQDSSTSDENIESDRSSGDEGRQKRKRESKKKNREKKIAKVSSRPDEEVDDNESAEADSSSASQNGVESAGVNRLSLDPEADPEAGGSGQQSDADG